MLLQGKGFFTYNLRDCEGGDPGSILAAAQAAGLSHVIVKIADGTQAAGIDTYGIDFTAPVAQALQQAGMGVWGWQYVYGDDPSAEAAIAITRMQALRLDGYVVSAGEEYEQPGRSGAAQLFITTIRAALKVPVALNSFRFPSYHPKFPWSDFLSFCDLHMPQVFWEQAHDADEQLSESKRQCDALPHARPYIPSGAAYSATDWSPTEQDLTDFLDTAQVLDLPAVNFFDWDACHTNLPLLWKTIAGFTWAGTAQADPAARTTSAAAGLAPNNPPDAFLLQFLAALNGRNAAQVTALYDPAATQVWADQTRRDAISIQAGFTAFFNSLPAGTVFTIASTQVNDDLLKFTWEAGSLTGETILTLQSGKIILDYTFIF
jgi:hypothetical protein